MKCIAVLCLLTAALTPASRAAVVTVTLSGTVYSGTDNYGNVFSSSGTSTSLAGLPFTLVFTFDDSQGTTTTANCSGVLFSSQTVGGSTGVGASAVLTIGGKPFTIGGGGLGQTSGSWYASQWAAIPCSSYPNGAMGYQVGASYSTGGYRGASLTGYGCCGPSVFPAPGTSFSSSYDWRTTLFHASTNSSSTDAFGFYVVYSSGNGATAYNASGYLAPQYLSINGQLVPQNGKTLGQACQTCFPAQPPGTNLTDSHAANGSAVGDPINGATGNVFEQATDYATAGQNPLAFIRSYNSMALPGGTFASMFGVGWRSSYDRYLHVFPASTPTTVVAERASGAGLTFTLQSGVWTPDTDVDMTLTLSGSTWTLTDHNDTVETYTDNGAGKAVLNSITLRNGYTQTLTYSGGLLRSVTDSYGRRLSFAYSGSLLSAVTTPESTSIGYGFSASLTGGVLDRLASVTWPTTPSSTLTYAYENASFPYALTGIIDENGARYATWAYDAQGRGISSKLGDTLAANQTTLTYNPDGTTTATNALGVPDTYTFTTLQGVPKVTQISRAATATTAAATRMFTYDNNGYLNSATDWDVNLTKYVNDTHGDPLTIDEAAGSPVARTTTIVYDRVFAHLPDTITTAGLTTTFAYDGSGNPLSRTDLDTTTNTVPYSTNGQARKTQWTWSSTGEMESVQFPRTDVAAETKFGYDSTGALISITDALSHLTQITQHTGGGRPLTIVDPNNVTTTLTYDGRLNLHTSTLQAGTGNLVATWTYDPANNLQSVQQPDGSKLTYAYDKAHRLTTVSDLLGNSVDYTLDALGDRTLIQVKNPSSTVTQQHAGIFDALGRVTNDIGGMGQTTKYSYDHMGNVLTRTPPAPSGALTQTWDALNRLSTHLDPSPGGTTTYTYDAHNRILSVKDANSHTTSYVYDGFGDRTQTASPDSGTTVFRYDPDRNLTQRVLAGSLTANMTYDALDRPLAMTYPSDGTLNVARTYDQTSHGFGIGRLTSATDQAGSLSLIYDERGNVTKENRTVTGAGALNTSTTMTPPATYPLSPTPRQRL